MEELTDSQRTCLQRLAHGGDGEVPCSAGVLEQLQRLGLAQRVSHGWLPLENPHTHYEITTAGKRLLERLARG